MATPISVPAVSVAGSLQNLNSNGFNTTDVTKELVDDSLGAEATSVAITLDPETKRARFADTGRGMNAERLALSHQLNTRSEVSETKHGRFGIGRSTALSYLSQNKGTATTISLADASNLKKNLVECTLDLAAAVATNQLTINAHGASMSSHEEWDATFGSPTATKRPTNTGTITSVQCEEGIFAELQDLMTTPDFTRNLLFNLGQTYGRAIEGGCAMTVAGKTIPAIDPLAWELIPAASKSVWELDIYRNTVHKQQFRVYYMHKGKRVYSEVNRETGRMKKFKDAPDAKWRKVTSFTVRAAHSRDWVALLRPKFEALGLPVPDSVSRDVMTALGGINIVRNGRIIFRVPVTMPTSGDFQERKYVVNTHIAVEFGATEFLDDAFGIMTNKNRIIWANVLEAIRSTVEDLHEGFGKEMWKVAKRAAATPVPVPGPSSGYALPVDADEETGSESGSVASGQLPAQQPAQPAIPIAPHTRAAARSEQDLLRRVLQFQEQLGDLDMDELARNASQNPRGGLSKLIAALDDIVGELNKIQPPS